MNANLNCNIIRSNIVPSLKDFLKENPVFTKQQLRDETGIMLHDLPRAAKKAGMEDTLNIIIIGNEAAYYTYEKEIAAELKMTALPEGITSERLLNEFNSILLSARAAFANSLTNRRVPDFSNNHSQHLNAQAYEELEQAPTDEDRIKKIEAEIVTLKSNREVYLNALTDNERQMYDNYRQLNEDYLVQLSHSYITQEEYNVLFDIIFNDTDEYVVSLDKPKDHPLEGLIKVDNDIFKLNEEKDEILPPPEQEPEEEILPAQSLTPNGTPVL